MRFDFIRLLARRISGFALKNAIAFTSRTKEKPRAAGFRESIGGHVGLRRRHVLAAAATAAGACGARGAAEGDLRFTVAPNRAFYLSSLTTPPGSLAVHSPVPVPDGARVTMLGYRGGPLHWSRTGSGITIDVPAAARDAGQYVWVFKVS